MDPTCHYTVADVKVMALNYDLQSFIINLNQGDPEPLLIFESESWLGIPTGACFFHFMTTSLRFKCVPSFCGSIGIHICSSLFVIIKYSSTMARILSDYALGCAQAQKL